MPPVPALCPADIGRRVTLRALRHDGAFDTVGELVSVDQHRVSVRRRDGEVVNLGWPPEPEKGLPPVVVGRVVPPDIGALALQEIAQAAWPPRETQTLGEWTMRWHGGVSGRANSVRVAGSPGQPLSQAAERVTEWYISHGGTPLLQVPRPFLAAELSAENWHVTRSVLALSIATRALETDIGPEQIRVTHSATPDEGWFGMLDEDADAKRQDLLDILTGPRDVTFATAVDSAGTVVGIGRGSLNSGWCGITSIVTSPQHRRQGIASVLTRSLGAWALGNGATMAYLQVLDTNVAARSLYEQLGFSVHHWYDYWEPDST
ncbi:MAG: GNAT family N-acetyltransferase [Actinomycetes bacterium]